MALGMIRYESSAKDLLHRFKFHDKTSLRHTFENIFRVFFKKHSILFPKNSLLIPIPLHPVRLRERGYDQALLLTNAISSITQLPVCPVLERIRNTPHQTSLKQKERFTNINGAFKMKPLSTVQNTNIILVDDLLTTGATVNEASRVLKSAGANSINVLTLAIT